jgi:hypothetical protein
LVGAGFIASLPIQMSRRIISLLIYVPVSAIAIYIFSAAFLFLWYGWVPVPRTPGPHDYSEQDVQSFITPGRPLAEITNRFGQPTFLRTNGEYLVWHFRSGLPETYPAKTVTIAGEPGYSFAGFTLWTTNGQAARWGASDWKK